MVGRGTRLHERKSDLVVVDIVDNSARHELAGLNALFDLPDSLDLGGRSATAVGDRLERVSVEAPWVDLGLIADAADLDHAAERIDLFRFEPPAEIAPFTTFAWCAAPDGGYRLNLADGERIDLRADNLGQWRASMENARDSTMLMPRPTANVHEAISMIDELVRRQRSGCVRLLTIDAGWRASEPTENQINLLRRRGVRMPSGLTRGQASWMITMLDRMRPRGS